MLVLFLWFLYRFQLINKQKDKNMDIGKLRLDEAQFDSANAITFHATYYDELTTSMTTDIRAAG